MGVADLRNAFNDACPAGYSAQTATLHYDGDPEMSYLTFAGNGPEGAFEMMSDPIPPLGDVMVIARQMAASIPPYVPPVVEPEPEPPVDPPPWTPP